MIPLVGQGPLNSRISEEIWVPSKQGLLLMLIFERLEEIIVVSAMMVVGNERDMKSR